MEERKKLTRSTTDKWVGGVCGGLAEFFGVDVTLVRVIFLVAMVGFGTGLLLYLALWLVMPARS